MKLYTFDSAPNPARLKRFMDYKGIQLDNEQIDMAKLGQHEAQYLAVVPEGTLPTLVLEDGTRLTEVIAIAHYLELIFPDRPLLGVTPLEKATILNWNHRIFNTIFMAVAEAFRNSHPGFVDRGLPGTKAYAQIPALIGRGRARLNHEFEGINRHLAQHAFVAGNNFSFADIDLLIALEFSRWAAKTAPSEALSAITNWRERATEQLQG